jgi:hypothetical protein
MLISLTGCLAGRRDTHELYILDEFHASFHDIRVESRFTLHGDVYVCGDRVLPAELIAGIRRIVLTSRREQADVLTQFDITPERVAEFRPAMLEAAGRMWPGQIPEELPPEWIAAFGYEGVCRLVTGAMTGPTGSTKQVLVRVTLPGNPRVTASSNCEHPYMLPWTICVDGRTWQTYSIDVPRALAVLADPTGPNTPLLDGAGYWQWDFWNDRDVWGMVAAGLIDFSKSEE